MSSTISSAPPVEAVVQGVEGPPNYDQPRSTQPSSEIQTSPTESRSGLVKRAMEKTADKLHRNKSAPQRTSQLSQSQPSLPMGSSSKRVFSLSRKGKERVSADGHGALSLSYEYPSAVPEHSPDETATAQSQLLGPVSRPSGHRRKSSSTSGHQADDDSPFITPRSPPFGPSRSFLSIFRGDGSVCHDIVSYWFHPLTASLDACRYANPNTSLTGPPLGRRPRCG